MSALAAVRRSPPRPLSCLSRPRYWAWVPASRPCLSSFGCARPSITLSLPLRRRFPLAVMVRPLRRLFPLPGPTPRAPFPTFPSVPGSGCRLAPCAWPPLFDRPSTPLRPPARLGLVVLRLGPRPLFFVPSAPPGSFPAFPSATSRAWPALLPCASPPVQPVPAGASARRLCGPGVRPFFFSSFIPLVLPPPFSGSPDMARFVQVLGARACPAPVLAAPGTLAATSFGLFSGPGARAPGRFAVTTWLMHLADARFRVLSSACSPALVLFSSLGGLLFLGFLVPRVALIGAPVAPRWSPPGPTPPGRLAFLLGRRCHLPAFRVLLCPRHARCPCRPCGTRAPLLVALRAHLAPGPPLLPCLAGLAARPAALALSLAATRPPPHCVRRAPRPLRGRPRPPSTLPILPPFLPRPRLPRACGLFACPFRCLWSAARLEPRSLSWAVSLRCCSPCCPLPLARTLHPACFSLAFFPRSLFASASFFSTRLTLSRRRSRHFCLGPLPLADGCGGRLAPPCACRRPSRACVVSRGPVGCARWACAGAPARLICSSPLPIGPAPRRAACLPGPSRPRASPLCSRPPHRRLPGRARNAFRGTQLPRSVCRLALDRRLPAWLPVCSARPTRLVFVPRRPACSPHPPAWCVSLPS